MDRTFTGEAVLVKSHYLLADWHRELLPFLAAVHIHRLKPCYFNLSKEQNKVLATVSNIERLKNELGAFGPP